MNLDRTLTMAISQVSSCIRTVEWWSGWWLGRRGQLWARQNSSHSAVGGNIMTAAKWGTVTRQTPQK
ncbi:hypothetical protein ACLKA6_005892 [Drosophila palustris]